MGAQKGTLLYVQSYKQNSLEATALDNQEKLQAFLQPDCMCFLALADFAVAQSTFSQISAITLNHIINTKPIA